MELGLWKVIHCNITTTVWVSTAIGLKHVQEYNHKEGNLLDVIIASNDVKYEHNCEAKDFLSDHCYVLFKTIR